MSQQPPSDSPAPAPAPPAASEASAETDAQPDSLALAPRPAGTLRLPDAPALVAGLGQSVLISPEGEVTPFLNPAAATVLDGQAPLLCHRGFTRKRLDLPRLPGLDILELFAFTRPARRCLPTPFGVARALGLEAEAGAVAEDQALMLVDSAQALLGQLIRLEGRARAEALALAWMMARGGWGWGPAVLAALGHEAGNEAGNEDGSGAGAGARASTSGRAGPGPGPPGGHRAMEVWRRLEPWSGEPPESPPGHRGVPAEAVRWRLAEMLAEPTRTGGGPVAEPRPAQIAYAETVAGAFQPVDPEMGAPVVLAEAGTGIGKTLGYLAPASLWAEANGAPVWVSTYTRNLQHQIDDELDRLFAEPATKARRVVLRKGRENYLCLLNLEEALSAAAAGTSGEAVAAGLMTRWAGATRQGDLQGGDFPGWLPEILGAGPTRGLSDRRGECIYSACPHYERCFIEGSIRRARRADIVVANHALVMINAALAQLDLPGDSAESETGSGADAGAGDRGGNRGGNRGKGGDGNGPGGARAHEGEGEGEGEGEDGPDPARGPLRLIFDEGHHLFQAADSAFASHLSAREAAELRRWLLGAGRRGRGSRNKGLAARLEDLAASDGALATHLDAVLKAAAVLPGPGWERRLDGDAPRGAAEQAFWRMRQLVLARADNPHSPYDLEIRPRALPAELLAAAERLETALAGLTEPARALVRHIRRRLADEPESFDSDTRRRLDAVSRGLWRRAGLTAGAWCQMLADLRAGAGDRPAEGEAGAVDWLGVSREDGRDRDIGLYRHHLDPSAPFAASVLAPAHGVAITSATLTDTRPAEEDGAKGERAQSEGAQSEGAKGDIADWAAVRAETGLVHLDRAPVESQLASPFDYAAQTRIFVIDDLPHGDLDALAGAYRGLFAAAGGGALGLFTAIARLREVHRRIAGPLESAGLPLLAQHIDGMDVHSLVDIFRARRDSCLLGTDAVRDGIDVPGAALRLMVLDRVPWPRPSILHRARRDAFGGRAYDDRLTRMRLKQAYGRLIRRRDDHGCFVLLDRRLPRRLSAAFPPEVTVERLGLGATVAAVRSFLAEKGPAGGGVAPD